MVWSDPTSAPGAAAIRSSATCHLCWTAVSLMAARVRRGGCLGSECAVTGDKGGGSTGSFLDIHGVTGAMLAATMPCSPVSSGEWRHAVGSTRRWCASRAGGGYSDQRLRVGKRHHAGACVCEEGRWTTAPPEGVVLRWSLSGALRREARLDEPPSDEGEDVLHPLDLADGPHAERAVQRRLVAGGLHADAVVVDCVEDAGLRCKLESSGDVLPQTVARALELEGAT